MYSKVEAVDWRCLGLYEGDENVVRGSVDGMIIEAH